MKWDVKYFGYGANRSEKMIKAIIGRMPVGHLATLYGYELCVQKWEEIPEGVRDILSRDWGPGFKAYCIRPAEFGIVEGYIWFLKTRERELVKNWGMVPRWYQEANVSVEILGGYSTHEGVETDVINDPNIQEVVDGENYKKFLNDKEKMLEVARRTREEYLKRKGSQ